MRNPTLIILECSASLSILCSLLTLLTIKRVKRWNGYIQLIFQLGFAQLLYDLSTLMVPLPGSTSYSIYVGFRSIFGMATTLWTNIIAGTVVYTVFHFKPFEVSKYINIIFFIIYIPSFINGILVGVYVQTEQLEIYSNIYFWVRVLSISFNILSYLFGKFILHFPSIHSHIHTSYQLQIAQEIPFSNSVSFRTASNDPLRAFIKRFQYYPLIQVICRVAVSWYEYVYGYSYNYHSTDTLLQQVLIFLYVIFLPSLGTFYFIIYINVSPNSYKQLSSDIERVFRIILSCGNLIFINRFNSIYSGNSQSLKLSSNGSSGNNNNNNNDNNNNNAFANLNIDLNNYTTHDSLSASEQNRSTIMSLYKPFLTERPSSLERHEMNSNIAPFHRTSHPQSFTLQARSSTTPSSRQVSSEENQSIRYDEYGEEELTKEITRIYEIREKGSSSRSTFN